MEPQQSYYTAHTDFEYPEEGQEQENEFRERALEMIRIMSLALYHVINSRTPNVTAFGVAYALCSEMNAWPRGRGNWACIKRPFPALLPNSLLRADSRPP